VRYSDASWSVVIELLLCKIDEEQPDYEIVDGLSKKILSSAKQAGLNLLLQVIKHLKNISPSMQKEVLSHAISFCLEDTSLDKTPEIKLVNQYLMDLVRFERFQVIFTRIIKDRIGTAKESDIIVLSQFHLENEMAVSQYNHLRISFPNIENIEDPYVYILRFLPEVTSIDAYYKCFCAFITKFGKNAVLKTYQTKYIGVIVDNEYFNWCTMLLFSSKTKEEFVNNLEHLKVYGIDLSDLNNIVKTQNIVINLEESLLVEIIRSTKNIAIRKILEKVKYIKYGADVTPPKTPYYKAFKKGKKNNKW